MATNGRKCYNCGLNPSTCLYKCGLAEEDWEFLRRDVCCETHDLKERCRKLALKKSVTDLTELQNEIRFLEHLLELDKPDLDYQTILKRLQRDYEIGSRLNY